MNRNTVLAMLAILLLASFVPFIPVEEEYNELEDYSRGATYTIVSSQLRESFDLSRGTYWIYEVVLKNTDDTAGTFQVTFELFVVAGLFGTKTNSAYIQPGSSQAIRVEFDTSLGQDVRGEHTINPPSVIDQRIVVKKRTINRSLVDILLYPR